MTYVLTAITQLWQIDRPVNTQQLYISLSFSLPSPQAHTHFVSTLAHTPHTRTRARAQVLIRILTQSHGQTHRQRDRHTKQQTPCMLMVREAFSSTETRLITITLERSRLHYLFNVMSGTLGSKGGGREH